MFIRNRWREHFETVLSRPIPLEEDIPSAQLDFNIEKGEVRPEELLKDYKAPGEDGIFPEMFKVEEDGLVYNLKNLFCET